jgi:peptide/nickel transport system ATP-binding protein
MSLLELDELSVTYRIASGDVPAVRGVSLSLEAGEALGVVGESGSGKSTLAMALLRLLPKDARTSGRIMLGGEDVLQMKWGRLRAVRWAEASIVFQGAQHGLRSRNPCWCTRSAPRRRLACGLPSCWRK